ncbi:MAG: acyl-ACP--UDP-N-acetylglucosamine O-acyltransferase [Cyclobacteriaceae bacterium]
MGPNCYFNGNITIGNNCRLISNVVLEGNVVIGDNNTIYPFTVIGTPAQDPKSTSLNTWVKIGDNNIIREFVSINRGTEQDSEVTIIGNHNTVMSYCHIGHDCIIEDHCSLSSYCGLSGHVQVMHHSKISGMCGISQHLRIGEYSFISGASAVVRDIPPYSYIMGTNQTPAIKGVNITGLKRNQFDLKNILAIQQAMVTWTGNCIEYDKDDLVKKYIDQFITFEKGTKKGVLKKIYA